MYKIAQIAEETLVMTMNKHGVPFVSKFNFSNVII